MNTERTRRARLTAVLLLLMVATSAACSSRNASAAKSDELIGLFRLTPGTVKDNRVGGTWFRMLQPGGSPARGPYMVNADSPADGGKVTLLRPGTSGGLRTQGYQSQSTPAFAANGDSTSDAITTPTKFFGVKFSISTNAVDPQTKAPVPPPSVKLVDGRLVADLSAWAASWNRQNFNQGAPKPVPNTGAKAPGQEKAEQVWDWVAGKYLDAAPAATTTGTDATGTYDPKTRAFVLQWTSHIQGGPFNGFTGLWHLEGTFVPGGRAPR